MKFYYLLITLTWRKRRWYYLVPRPCLKYSLSHGFFDMFASITQVQSHYSLMAQNNSVFIFVWKTINDSCGRTNLRIDMNQVTNLKSLEWRKIANLLGVSTSFWSKFSEIVQFVVDGVAKLKFVSVEVCICRSRWFPCSYLLSPLSLFWQSITF